MPSRRIKYGEPLLALDNPKAGDLSVRAFKGLLLHFERTCGTADLRELLGYANLGEGVDLMYLQDQNNWLSFAASQRLIDLLDEHSVDPNFIRNAAYLTASREVLGFTYGIIRAIGTPKACYAQLFRRPSIYNRVGEFRVIELSRRHLIFSYESRVEEPNLRFSDLRLHQFCSFPAIWGLPPADGKRIACQVTGNAPRSIYELHWGKPASNLRSIVLGVLGVSTALAINSFFRLETAALLVPMGFLGGLLPGFLWDQRKRYTQRERTLQQHSDEMLQSMLEIQARSDEVQALNESLEQKVEERTEELAQANEQLKQLDEAKSRFFATISHELRTPLTLALGPVESMMEEVSGRQYDQLSMVHDNQQRLLRAIEELLALAQLESGQVDLNCRELDMREVIGEVGHAARGAMEHKGITFTVETPKEPVRVFVDRLKFDRVLLNLVNNAMKFTPDGKSVTLRLRTTDTHAWIDVEDTGIGIPVEKQQSVFERFFQVDSSKTRKYSGTGIGLSLVQEYTELHGGEVKLRSAEDVGTMFSLSIPFGRDHLTDEQIVDQADDKPDALAATNTDRYRLEFGLLGQESTGDDDADATPVPSSIRRATGPMYPIARAQDRETRGLLKGARVLIVDDSADMRRLIRSELGDTFEIISASNGLEGWEKATTCEADLVLTDLMMPGISGGELCRRIKEADEPLCRTPVVLLTALADQQTKLKILGHGADDYLLKPFASRELRLRVRNLIVKHRQERALHAAHAAIAEQQRILAEDLEIASQFQRKLLPELSMNTPFEAHAEFRPMTKVGGDFFHAQQIQPGWIRLMVGDISGHGVQASLRMTVAYAEYTSLDHSKLAPNEVLGRLNDIAIDKYGELSGCFACVDLLHKDGETRLSYAQAGRAPVVQVDANTCEELPQLQGMVLGILPDVEFELGQRRIEPGSRLFLYTDGLYGQEDERERLFADYLNGALNDTRKYEDLRSATHSILSHFDHFRKSRPQVDDVTIIGIGRTAS